MKNAIFDVKMNPKHLHHFSLLSIEIYSRSVGFKICADLPAVNDMQPYFISQHFITININFLSEAALAHLLCNYSSCVCLKNRGFTRWHTSSRRHRSKQLWDVHFLLLQSPCVVYCFLWALLLLV